MLKNVVLLDACRTPIGRLGGVLSGVRPDDLLAHTILSIIARNPWLDVAQIEDVQAGAANQAGEDNRNVARMAVLLAGLPDTVPGATVNRLCASGLEAIACAARAIEVGEGAFYLAGGVESMSRAPYVMGKAATVQDRAQQLQDTTLGWRFINPRLSAKYAPISMGETAENVAERYNISRTEQDAYGLESQHRYAAALAAGHFADEMIGIDVPAAKGQTTRVEADEHPRQTTLEKLAELKPAFKPGGTVTAGNAAGLNDGAAMALVASAAAAKAAGRTPLAYIRAIAVAGVDPLVMGLGPIPAIQKLLARTGLTLADIDLIEINEAFAAQVIACRNELGIDGAKLNVNGGAIALGHPLGMSGARLTGTLAYQMRRQGARYGIAAMCVGVGQGMAALLERP